MKNTGFTLIELIVVIAIIAILAAIIAPNAFRAIEKAKISATIEDYRSIKTAAMAYYSDAGQWPAQAEGTPPRSTTTEGFITTPAPAVAGWDGPYLEKWPPVARWGGGAVTYWLRSDAVAPYATGWGAAGVNKRMVEITLVPEEAARRISLELDGTQAAVGSADTDGVVRYNAGTTVTLLMLISND